MEPVSRPGGVPPALHFFGGFTSSCFSLLATKQSKLCSFSFCKHIFLLPDCVNSRLHLHPEWKIHMSLSARERNNPPSRRKSCAACTKAKRRCDFAVPACLRCSQRSIPCQYPLRKSRVVVTSPPRTGAADMTTRHLPTLAPSVPLVTHIETTPEDFDAAITSIDSCWDGFSAFDLPEEDSILDLVEQQPFMLSPPSSKDLDAVSEVIANRLQWAVDRIQEAPKTMVLETQTPWSHPFLWREGMPRSMQGEEAQFYIISCISLPHSRH